jgi:hypothetical protein
MAVHTMYTMNYDNSEDLALGQCCQIAVYTAILLKYSGK